MVLPLCMNLPGFRAIVLTDSSQGGVIAEIITALGNFFKQGIKESFLSGMAIPSSTLNTTALFILLKSLA